MSVLSKYLSVIVWALAMLVLAVPASAQAQRDIAQDSAPFVYEVERLENGGGGGAGAPLDLDTPLGLVESFMAASGLPQRSILPISTRPLARCRGAMSPPRFTTFSIARL